MTPVRAPADAIAWSAPDGWVFDQAEAQRALEQNGWTLIVSTDGRVHVGDDETAPLSASLRTDADLVEVVARLDDLADAIAGLDVGEAGDVAELRSRLRSLGERVRRLEGDT